MANIFGGLELDKKNIFEGLEMTEEDIKQDNNYKFKLPQFNLPKYQLPTYTGLLGGNTPRNSCLLYTSPSPRD